MRLPHLALVCTLGLGLVACSDDAPAARDDSDAQSKIIQPGRPGEANETVDPDEVVAQPGTNAADITFMQRMVPHHAQALEMSRLARTRARDAEVAAMARRIKGAQKPEIVSMGSWLESRDLEVPRTMDDLPGMGHGGHGAMAMQGMLSDRQMSELADARGSDFDQLFVAGMIQHHEGAVAMARDEMQAGSDTLALELAADVAAGQQAEIARLEAIGRDL